MNKRAVAQELVKVAKSLVARYPSNYFKSSGVRSRAESSGLMDVENEDLTASGLIAKLEEWQESEGGVDAFVYRDAQKLLMKQGLRMPPGIRKASKSRVAGERVLATNRSSNSWEDFSSIATAKVYADDAGNLRLEIRADVENVGINSYKRSAVVATQELGTLVRPRLGGVSSLLKKHGHDRSRAGGPFSSKWTDASGQKANLTEIIKVEAERAQPAPVAVSAPSAPAAKPVPTSEDQAVLKQLLKDVDIGTVDVEAATDKVLEVIKTGDRKAIDHALGFLEGTIDRLVKEAESYKKVVRQLA